MREGRGWYHGLEERVVLEGNVLAAHKHGGGRDERCVRRLGWEKALLGCAGYVVVTTTQMLLLRVLRTAGYVTGQTCAVAATARAACLLPAVHGLDHVEKSGGGPRHVQ